MADKAWHEIKLPEGSELLRKEWYLYRVHNEEFNVELFETSAGEFYAIGTPVDSERLVIYGSALVKDPVKALDQTLLKINRELTQQEIQHIGEDVGDQREE